MELKELRKMRNEIIEQYNNGKTFDDLKQLYSTTWSNIYDVVAVGFEHKYANVLNEQKIEIVNMYKNGLSITQIGEKLKIHHKLISVILEENNIKRTNNNKRTYKLNEYYFNKIDTPNKAYILGFLYADGCTVIDKCTVSISLEETDREILEKIRLEIGSEKQLEFVEQSKRSDKNNSYNY